MAGFLYFVAADKEGVASVDTLKAGGIYYAFEDDGFLGMPKCVFTRSGPGGKTGWLLGDEKALGRLQVAYFPDDQTWRKIHGTSSHVGVYNDHHPSSEDLLRKRPLEGYTIELLDGCSWVVPRYRAHFDDNENSILPCYLDLDDQGEWVSGSILDRWTRLYEIGSTFWNIWEPACKDSIKTGEACIVEHEPTIDDAMYVLSKNYRVGKTECVLLRLFADRGVEVCISILELLCDCPAAFEILKKKDSDSTSTDAGSKD